MSSIFSFCENVLLWDIETVADSINIFPKLFSDRSKRLDLILGNAFNVVLIKHRQLVIIHMHYFSIPAGKYKMAASKKCHRDSKLAISVYLRGKKVVSLVQ